MAWYNPLSWSDKVIDNVLDKESGILVKVGGWIDGQQYTEQETAEDKKDLRKGVINYAIASMGENSERSKSRREIAKMWIKVQLWIVLMCCIAAPWNMILAEFYFKLATSVLMVTGTSAIIIFHFGSYGLTRHNETKKAAK
jgi:hypothetical protein